MFQDDECVTAMNSIPPGEIMGRVHIADQYDKAPATKGIDAWKGHPANKFQGYIYVPNIALSWFLQSHCTRVQPLVVAIPFAKPAMSCLDFLSPHAHCPDQIGELGLAR